MQYYKIGAIIMLHKVYESKANKKKMRVGLFTVNIKAWLCKNTLNTYDVFSFSYVIAKCFER